MKILRIVSGMLVFFIALYVTSMSRDLPTQTQNITIASIDRSGVSCSLVLDTPQGSVTLTDTLESCDGLVEGQDVTEYFG